MLVPLQTLFGWPAAPNPSPLASLGLLFGLPIAVIVIAFAVAKIGNGVKDRQTGGGVLASDPVWMGGQARSIMGGPDNELTHVAQSERARLEEKPTAQDKAERPQARQQDPQIVGNDDSPSPSQSRANADSDADADEAHSDSDADADEAQSGAGAARSSSTGGASARW